MVELVCKRAETYVCRLIVVVCHCMKISRFVTLLPFIGSGPFSASRNSNWVQGRRLRVGSGATAPGPALEGAPRFRPMSLSSYILL